MRRLFISTSNILISSLGQVFSEAVVVVCTWTSRNDRMAKKNAMGWDMMLSARARVPVLICYID